jgi:D-3-phosphoglycerate dehydrogenase
VRDKKVYFIDTVHAVLHERLTRSGFDCIDITNDRIEQIPEKIFDAFGLVIRSKISLTKELLTRCENLKFIARSGSGLENIDVEFCNKKSIKCYNSPEGNRNAVAEHGLGMLLSLLNRIHISDLQIRNGIWQRESNRGEELDGKTVGIIGYGNNGAAFAKKLRGFDVKVLAYDKYKSGFGDHFVHECTLNAIMEKADIISFHVPLNKETKHILNEEFINKMAKPFILINMSRGRVVHTQSLVEGLKSHKVKGACLDVLEYEKKSFETFFEQNLPEEFSYLTSCERVVMTPHIAGWTTESYFKLSNILADKILADYSVH